VKGVFGITIWLIAILAMVGVADIGAATQNLSNSGGGSWQYYRDINISEKSGSMLTNYQILLQLSSDNFTNGAQIYGEDIRFMDVKGNELSYWIEYWDAIGRSARIWVKVNIPQRGSTSIRMYYGNPNASSSSNGSRTNAYSDTNCDTNANGYKST
jgi:hypothetical protein